MRMEEWTEAETSARLRALYPFVDETKTPLPRAWSPADKCACLGLSHDNLRLSYKGQGKNHKDAGAVRTAMPIPATAGLYYFEVHVVSKGRDGYMGLGLCQKEVPMSRLPGWEKGSYGYHGDDGNAFSASGNGTVYGPTFGTGDVVGCGYDLVNRTAFYTKNGQHLGIAFRELPPGDYYPTLGLQTPGEVVHVNFGQAPFQYDLEGEIGRSRRRVAAAISGTSGWAERTTAASSKEAMDNLVGAFLIHQGYASTAQAFHAQAPTTPTAKVDLGPVRHRQEMQALVLSGRLGRAIQAVEVAHPGLLQRRPDLLFRLHLQHLVELIATPEAGASELAYPHVLPRRSSRQPSPSATSNGASAASSTAAAASADVEMEEEEDSQAEEEEDVEEEARETSSNGLSAANGNGVAPAPTPPVFTIPPQPLPGNLDSILSFGKELRRFFEEKIRGKEAEAEELEGRMKEVFSLLAYPDPASSPLAHLLRPSQRQPVAAALNAAILREEAQGEWSGSTLETLMLHCGALRSRMADEGLGAAAFADPPP